jgi:hypothetical protein
LANPSRNIVAHALWTTGGASHVSRNTLQRSLHYSDLDDLRALTTKAKALMIPDVPRPDLTDATFVLGLGFLKSLPDLLAERISSPSATLPLRTIFVRRAHYRGESACPRRHLAADSSIILTREISVI